MKLRMRNGIKHLCSDGCMFGDEVMTKQVTWTSLLSVMWSCAKKFVEMGLPEDEAPKLHIAVWPRHVGRGDDSDIGEVIPLDTMLGYVVNAVTPDGKRADGIDLMEGADLAHDAPAEEFDAFVAFLKKHNLVVGDIVALVWPGAGGGVAFGDAEHRAKRLTAIRNACLLAKRLCEAGVRFYGRIRIDSSGDVPSYNEAPEQNWRRLVVAFQDECDVAAEFNESLVFEGEISWGGMAGWRQCKELHAAVNRPNFYYQMDLAHSMLFIGAYNVDAVDSLLPENVVPHKPTEEELEANADLRQATPDELAAAMKSLATEVAPFTGSLHVAQSRAGVKGGGDHPYTGEHWPVGDADTTNEGLLDIVEAMPDFALEHAE